MTQWQRDLPRYRRLIRYAAPYRGGWALIGTISLLNAGVSLLQPWPMKILLDHVLGTVPLPAFLARLVGNSPRPEAALELLGVVVLGGLAIFAINSVAEIVLTINWVRVGQQMVYDLARDLFFHLQRRSLLFHTRNPVGDSIGRVMSDSWCVNSIVDSLLFSPIQTVLLIAGMLTVMFRMDVTLTLIALAMAPLMALAAVWLGRGVRSAARAGREVQSRIRAHVQQTLSGIPVVQAFAQEDREHRRFLEFAGAAIQAQQRVTMVSSIYNLGSGLFLTLGTALILWVGAHRSLEGSLTVGSLLVFLAYLTSLQAQFRKLASLYEALQKTNASMDRVMEIMESPPEVPDQPDAPPLPQVKGHVLIEKVSFGYETGRELLHEVTLEARPGERIAIVGPTGAGKSTLVSLVPRFHDPWTGHVLIDGQDVRAVRLKSLRDQVAVVFQEPFLLPMTIAETIAFGRPGASREEIAAAARAANAHLFIEKLPLGYDTLLGERGATLSGGERQRLSIARALLKDAPILILDEPTSALDAQTEALLLEALDRLMHNRTTLIIAHRLSTIREANLIAVLKNGKIVERGTHRELLEIGGEYARLNARQTEPRAGAQTTGGEP